MRKSETKGMRKEMKVAELANTARLSPNLSTTFTDRLYIRTSDKTTHPDLIVKKPRRQEVQGKGGSDVVQLFLWHIDL